MNAKYKPIALYILENYTDEVMTENGFKRRGNSLNYFRTIGTTKQKLEMAFFSHPPYYAGTLLHIYPYMSVHFPEINETAKNMIDDVDDATIRTPIQMKPFDTTEWVLMTDAKGEVNAVAEKIKLFLKQNIIPRFNNLKTIDGYIDEYEQHDKWVVLSEKGYFYAASAYVIRGEYEKGLEVLNNRFVGPAIRKYYVKAFEYFETKLGK